jgi:hypothetical protein
MPTQTRYGLALLVMVAIVGGALFYLLQPQFGTGQIELSREFESNAFRFRYPDGWQHQIPQTNMLFLVSPEVLQQQEGATITIQRSVRLAAEAETLADSLDIYLQRGPLRTDRAWSIVEDGHATMFNNREALTVVLEGAEVARTTPMHSEVFITETGNGFVFIFTMTAPQEQWTPLEPTLSAILQSVEILE